MIDIRHLSLSFDGHTSILQDIDFQQSEGEFVAIVGPSGCGKTTLLNLCAGLVDLPPGEHLTLAGHAPGRRQLS